MDSITVMSTQMLVGAPKMATRAPMMMEDTIHRTAATMVFIQMTAM